MNSSSVQNTVEFEAILRELELAENPLTSAALSKRLKKKMTGKAFKPTLDDEVRAGRIHSWGDRYWDRNPRDVARERLLRVTASELLTADPLNKRVAPESPKIKQNVVIDVRKELIRDGSLRKVAPPRGSKTKGKVIVNVSHPEPYLKVEIGRLLEDFGIKRSTQQILALLAPAQAQPQVEVQTGAEPDVREIAETIFAAMNRVDSPGATVTFYRLRQQPELASVPKAIFDKAALLLQQDRKAMLTVHDHAARLPHSEQDELVTDGLGNYYASIYAL